MLVTLCLYLCCSLLHITSLDDMILVLQWGRLRWCWHVLRGGDTGWVKGCVECEVGGSGPGSGPGGREGGCVGGLSTTWFGHGGCCGSW